MLENLHLTQEWDKVFPKSDKVDHRKITFHNRYGITLAADLYAPRQAACNRGLRTVWRGKGAGLRVICTGDG